MITTLLNESWDLNLGLTCPEALSRTLYLHFLLLSRRPQWEVRLDSVQAWKYSGPSGYNSAVCTSNDPAGLRKKLPLLICANAFISNFFLPCWSAVTWRLAGVSVSPSRWWWCPVCMHTPCGKLLWGLEWIVSAVTAALYTVLSQTNDNRNHDSGREKPNHVGTFQRW